MSNASEVPRLCDVCLASRESEDGVMKIVRTWNLEAFRKILASSAFLRYDRLRCGDSLERDCLLLRLQLEHYCTLYISVTRTVNCYHLIKSTSLAAGFTPRSRYDKHGWTFQGTISFQIPSCSWLLMLIKTQETCNSRGH